MPAMLFLVQYIYDYLLCNSPPKPYSFVSLPLQSGLTSITYNKKALILFIIFGVLVCFLFYFFDLNIIPIAYAETPSESGESELDSDSSYEGSSIQRFIEICEESIDQDHRINNSREADNRLPDHIMIGSVYEEFIRNLKEFSDLDLDGRNEVLQAIKDRFIDHGYDAEMVNELVPMNPAAYDDVTDSSTGSDPTSPYTQEDVMDFSDGQEQQVDANLAQEQEQSTSEPQQQSTSEPQQQEKDNSASQEQVNRSDHDISNKRRRIN